MRITEVHVKLATDKDTKLRAFCSITLDDEFVIRDIKVIQRADRFFVAMPSRKMSCHCPRCNGKNPLQARFCNHCGAELPKSPVEKGPHGKPKLHADIAHPINTTCRQTIEETVVAAFQEELNKSMLPDYQPPDLDELDDETTETES